MDRKGSGPPERFPIPTGVVPCGGVVAGLLGPVIFAKACDKSFDEEKQAMIRIATDGSCIQQGDFRAGDDTPRPGAYGMIADLGGGRIVRRAVPEANGLIGGMEVSGLLMALEFVRNLDGEFRTTPVLIQCDSQYVVNTFNEWMIGWQANGWRKKKGAIANLDLWKRIWDVRAAIADRLPKVEWIKAHQNVGGLNDQTDAMVNTCARTQKPVTQYEAPPGSFGGIELPPMPTQAQYEEASAAIDRTLGAFTKHPPIQMEVLRDGCLPRAAQPAIPADEIDLGPPWEVAAGEGTEFRAGPLLTTEGLLGRSAPLHKPRADTPEDILRALVTAADNGLERAEAVLRDLAERARRILP